MVEEKQKVDASPVESKKPVVKPQDNFRHFVRVAQTDLDGKKSLVMGLRKIKGVGAIFANMVCALSKISTTKKVGDLNDADVATLDAVLKDPKAAGAPLWTLNRRKDMDTGEDMHLITNDLIFVKDNDIKALKKMKSYRGVRHMQNKPVRGQKTKSNFRKHKGKVSLGVRKKSGSKAGRV
ncbi:MAG: 30S ribosomal protein S13 [Nanoarchaeota archaeon]|nr:30S ribosomal protein S13 [Nanoarchaeota archaeon]